MAVKGVYRVEHVGSPSNNGTFAVDVSIMGFENGNIVEEGSSFTIDANLAAVMESDLSTAVTNWLINEKSYTFGLLDTVQKI